MLHVSPTGLIVIAVVIVGRILLQSGLRALPWRRVRNADRERD